MNNIKTFVYSFGLLGEDEYSVKNHSGENVVLGENVFLYFEDNKINLNIGEVHFSPSSFETKIRDTYISVKDNCIFWLNENECKFGFGYILYPDPSCEEGFDYLKEENKVCQLVKNYFLKKYNESWKEYKSSNKDHAATMKHENESADIMEDKDSIIDKIRNSYEDCTAHTIIHLKNKIA